jgi:competence protein ComEC
LYLTVPWSTNIESASEITFLDVGRGDAFVLRSKEGGTILFDCGGSSENIGEDVIAPYLWHRGITSIDAVILSHSDSDHFCGLPDLLERFRIGAVVVSRFFERNKEGSDFLMDVRNWDIPIVTVVPEQRFETAGISFEVLAPCSDEHFGKTLFDNDTSLILRATAGKARFLLTGDAGEIEIAALLDSGTDISCDVLAVPHHGARNRLLRELVARSGARFAVVSGGYTQGQAVKELDLPHAMLLFTRDRGAITIRYSDSEFNVHTFRGH